MRLFKSDWVDWVLQTLKVPDDVPIENKRVTGAIASAQAQVESQNFESRKNVLKYDDVMSRQREVVYRERRRILEGEDLSELARQMIDETVEGYVVGATEGFPEEWDLDALWTAMKQLYPVSFTRQEFEDEYGGREALDRDLLVERLRADAQQAYDAREAGLGGEVMRELERRVLLSVLDRKWREHLYEMDYLREGIGLRAYSQRDPLVEYQREGFDMFSTMMDGIKEESVGFLFNLEVQVETDDPDGLDDGSGAVSDEADADSQPLLDSAAPAGGTASDGEGHPQIHAKGLAPSGPRELTYAAPSADGDAEVEVHRERVEEPDSAPEPVRAGARRPAPRTGPRTGTKKSRNKKKRR
jgi:preprotein translocase subunit SecA